MKGTDVLDGTPLDLYRDVFDISKNESLLKNWISNDYKNNVFSRHLRAHLTDLFLDIFKINQRGRFPVTEKSKNVEVFVESYNHLTKTSVFLKFSRLQKTVFFSQNQN